jgi:1,4-dihydroxy-2-naphthoate octaprenyltransferase
MDDLSQNRFVLFLKLSRPYLLLAGVLPVFLGAGIARYLGRSIDSNVLYFGLFWVLALQLGMQYLNEYFDLYVEPDPETRTWFFSGSQVLGTGEGKLPRRTALVAAMAALTVAAAFTLMLFWENRLGLNSTILMLLMFIAVLAYSLPPIRLARSGYGELVLALVYGFLIPAFSFDLQTGEIHRLVTMAAVPLVLIIIPAAVVLSFPGYSTDLKYKRGNMLQKIGWQNSMMVHNTLILLAYLALAAELFIGFPRSIGLTVFASFPLGLLQIWLMRRIAGGAKPIWRAVVFNAVALVGSMFFLMVFVFWTR